MEDCGEWGYEEDNEGGGKTILRVLSAYQIP